MVELKPGNLHWDGIGGPYEQKIVEGHLILSNCGAQELFFLRIDPHGKSLSTMLSHSTLKIPRLAAGAIALVPIRAASVLDEFHLEVSVRMREGILGRDKEQLLEVRFSLPDRTDPEDSVFISYRSSELSIVLPVVNELKSIGLRIWIAEYDIHPSDWFPDKITSALRKSRHLVIFVSEAAMSSPWIRDELQLAAKMIGDGSLRQIIPVLLPGSRETPDSLSGFEAIFLDADTGRTAREIADRIQDGRHHAAIPP